MDLALKAEAKRLASALGVDPLYVVTNCDPFRQLSATERRFVRPEADGPIVAFTSAVCDLLFKKSFLRYEWRGRGCCMVYPTAPALLGREETLGALIHELAHYVADSNAPWRDDANEERALKAFWSHGRKTERQAHNRRWLRATVHLWWRACEAGYKIGLENVLDLEQYGYGPKDLAPLLAEAQRRPRESVERILDSPSPIARQAKARSPRRRPRRTKSAAPSLTPARTKAAPVGLRQRRPRAQAGGTESLRAGSPARIINGVGFIPVAGLLDGPAYREIGRDFDAAMDSSAVRGVAFYFNSPGGSAIGPKALADNIYGASGEKPIRAYVQGTCGSAAYYLAAACDRIYATADSLVGGLGAIFPHTEYSGALKDAGLAMEVFTNSESPKKGHGNPYEPLTDEARATLRNFVESYGRPFIDDVARYRAVDRKAVVSKYGGGDALRADVAVGHGIIDAVVSGYDEAVEGVATASRSDRQVAAVTRSVCRRLDAAPTRLGSWAPMGVLPMVLHQSTVVFRR